MIGTLSTYGPRPVAFDLALATGFTRAHRASFGTMRVGWMDSWDCDSVAARKGAGGLGRGEWLRSLRFGDWGG